MNRRRWAWWTALGAVALAVFTIWGWRSARPTAIAATIIAPDPGLQPIGPYVLSADGRTLGLIVAPSASDIRPGSVAYAASVRESAETVTISVTATPRDTPASSLPIGFGATRTLDVQLAEPLGSREVIDAATGRPLSPVSPAR